MLTWQNSQLPYSSPGITRHASRCLKKMRRAFSATCISPRSDIRRRCVKNAPFSHAELRARTRGGPKRKPPPGLEAVPCTSMFCNEGTTAKRQKYSGQLSWLDRKLPRQCPGIVTGHAKIDASRADIRMAQQFLACREVLRLRVKICWLGTADRVR